MAKIRNTPEGYHKNFAVALCRRGFAVVAPEISCFGERQTDFSHLNITISWQGKKEYTSLPDFALQANLPS